MCRFGRQTNTTSRLSTCTSECIIELLLTESPESIDIQDSNGKKPLSIARSSSDPNREKINEALEKRPWCYSLKTGEEKFKKNEQSRMKAYAVAFEKRFKSSQQKQGAVITALENLVTDLRGKVSELKTKLRISETKVQDYGRR